MNPILLSPLPFLITLSTAFGVVIHDTQLDMAAKTALTIPYAVVDFAGSEMSMKFNDPHTHSENSSVTQNLRDMKADQPRTQTRGGDDKKYVVQKKSSVHSFGSEYIWPSI